MNRVISIYLPTWPTDRLRRLPGGAAPSPDVPLALKGSDGRRRVVNAVDDFAYKLGIRIGMPVAKAQALIEDLVLMDADPDADLRGLDDLALWALRRYSPLVMSDGSDGLVIDIAGASHRFGGERAVLDDLLSQLAAMAITARAALSDTWGASHALARYCATDITLIEPGRTTDAILNLPVRSLRLPANTIDDLLVLGFDRIGELASQPRAPLTLRFGKALFQQIDMAFGRMAEPISPIEPPELILVSKAFFEPIGAPETIAKYTDHLVEEICLLLEEAGEGALQLDLRFHRVDSRVEAIQVRMGKPVRDDVRLSKLLCAKIEQVDPGFGIERMVARTNQTFKSVA
ncbi:Y-family DNA polymerase [Asticcacaulis sp. W401b]|uniref:Y-family DNA polymerase n=1 Tax=Asticcacaulis sp. W401b TaxID=3388666 RepID=UPI0039707C52